MATTAKASIGVPNDAPASRESIINKTTMVFGVRLPVEPCPVTVDGAVVPLMKPQRWERRWRLIETIGVVCMLAFKACRTRSVEAGSACKITSVTLRRWTIEAAGTRAVQSAWSSCHRIWTSKCSTAGESKVTVGPKCTRTWSACTTVQRWHSSHTGRPAITVTDWWMLGCLTCFRTLGQLKAISTMCGGTAKVISRTQRLVVGDC